MWRVFRLVVIGIPFLVAACSADEQIGRAEAQISDFHKKFNAGQFLAIYEGSSPEFKDSASKDEMVRFFEGVRAKLGDVANTKKAGWHVNYSGSDTIVTLTCETQFTKGSATEVFMYRIAGQKTILAGYRIDSRDLVAR